MNKTLCHTIECKNCLFSTATLVQIPLLFYLIFVFIFKIQISLFFIFYTGTYTGVLGFIPPPKKKLYFVYVANFIHLFD